MSEAYKIASETVQRNPQRGEKQYGKKVCRIVLEPGDTVLVRNMSEREGPRKCRSYRKTNSMLLSGKKVNAFHYTKLHQKINLLLPCTYLPMNKLGLI